MRILVSNDDGINAPGIAALCMAVQDMGEIIVAAPDTQQSAVSQQVAFLERHFGKKLVERGKGRFSLTEAGG